MRGRWISGQRILGLLVLAMLALAAWYLLRKPALGVDAGEVTRGPLAVTIDELGETRVRDLYTVASPVTGELLRVALKPGALVEQGRTLLAEVQASEPDALDARSYSRTVAQVEAMEAGLAGARAQVAEARAAERLAEQDHARVAQLLARGFATRARFDQAVAERNRARAAVAAATQAQDAALHNLQAAQAALTGGTRAAPGQARRIVAPVSGRVLRVLQESRRPVVPGTPILEIGDPARIEVVADLLSGDAVRVRPGAAVAIDAWGGDRPLRGTVRLVEPYGFTKVSALGVEEQRVNVVIDLAEPAEAFARLGHGYRVTVRIAQWQADNVLRVPVGALFRAGESWAVFLIDANGRSRQVAVRIGQRNDEQAEVLAGLSEGDRVVLHPSEKVGSGSRVKPAS